MLVGGWSRPQPPLKGELLTSCLARNAQAHGTTPYRLLALFWQRDPVWERDFDRDPGALRRCGISHGRRDWLTDFAECLKTDRRVVEAATLLGWRAVLGGEGRPLGDTPLVLSAGVHHRTRTLHALQHCPACLADGTPFFRKEWRLGFVVACERHRAWLMDACPHCDAPVVPHRSMTPLITDCHECGRSVMDAPRMPLEREPPPEEMQARLLRLLGGDADATEPWRDQAGFDVLRALLAVSAAVSVRVRLRETFGLSAMERSHDRMRFEQSRLSIRAPWLETMAAWTRAWPQSFHQGAEAAGLTRRSFARTRQAKPLADQVARLPPGTKRDRTWTPVLEEPVLKRLRRTDRQAYRSLRATRILDAVGERQ